MAIWGASELITALPTGWAADRYPRAKIVAVGGVAMLVAVGACIYGINAAAHDSSSRPLYFLTAGLVVFGFAEGVMNGPAQALLTLILIPNPDPIPTLTISIT